MSNELTKDLKFRHVMMITIGGTIGTGLFVGISAPLNVAGNLGTPIAYAIAGFVMLLTMLNLGELSSAIPHTGSFQHYLSIFFKNQYWSYMMGWLYWLSWVLAISADLTATSMTLHDLFPAISTTAYISIILAFLAAIHLYTVTAYGESESLFTSIKIITIVFFLGACLYLLFVTPENTQLTTILMPSIGLPNGIIGILACMTTVTYAFQGIEMIGTLAGESDDAAKAMSKAIKMLITRVFLFYFLSALLLALVYPPGYQAAISPFVWVFSQLGIPNADIFMKLIIILCGLSASSGALYASSRLLWSMSKDNIAPTIFRSTSAKGSPYYAILFTLAIASIALLSQFITPQKFFIYLIASTGQVGCLAWFCISLCQYRFRKAKQAGLYPEYQLKYRSPLFPLLSLMAMGLNLIIICGLWLSDDGINILVGEAILITFLSISYLIRNNKRPSYKVLHR